MPGNNILSETEQLKKINEIADRYEENFIEWGISDSAKAFHEILEIIGRNQIPLKNRSTQTGE